MQIDWITVVAQIVNFLILVWLLKRFLYQPVVNAMAAREQRIAARLEEAHHREDKAEAEARQYREERQALEREREEKLAAARQDAEREKHRLVDEARAHIERQHEQWRAELRREQDDFRKALGEELAASVVELSRRALADLADAKLEQQILAALLKQWNDLPEDERAKLQQATEPLHVISSFPLDDADRKRLRSALGAAAGVDFETDTALVCGIALVGPGHRVEWNVRDYLEDIGDRVREQLGAPAARAPERV